LYTVDAGKKEPNGLYSPERLGIDAGRWRPIPRGYPEGMQVLTEYGFIDFRLLFSSEYLDSPVPFVKDKPAVLKDLNGEIQWGQWKVKDNFPRVASVDPATGDVSYVKPVRFSYYLYFNPLVHIKGKGIDLLASMDADLWLKGRYNRSWKFMPASRVVEFRKYKTHFHINNKYNEELYGDYMPSELIEPTEEEIFEYGFKAEERGMLKSELRPRFKYPFPIIPKKHARRRLIRNVYNYHHLDSSGKKIYADAIRKSVPLYNLDVPPNHLIIVRRGKIRDNITALPPGSPCIVGDGIDKSLVKANLIKKGLEVGVSDASYSDIRPDFKSFASSITGEGISRNAYAEEYENE
jgi:hypothetical protein